MSASEDRAVEASARAEVVTLSRNKLWVILIMVWAMSCVTSAGVSWYFAGVSSDRSNAALAKIVQLQRDQGSKGLDVLYQSALTRCQNGITARSVAINNAVIQRDHDGADVQIPPKLPPCKDSVANPNVIVGTAVHTGG